MRGYVTKGWCAALALSLAAPDTASGQPQSAQERRDELARVQELVNDPDPLMRIANFEALIAERDAVKLRIAIGIALSSDDQMLRSLAFKAYLASVERFVFELSLDPSLQQRIDRAQQQGSRELQTFTRTVHNLDSLLRFGTRLHFQIGEFDVRSARGKVSVAISHVRAHDAIVSGDRLIFQTERNFFSNGPACDWELRPSRDLTIDGFFTCVGAGFGRVMLTAPMY